MADLTPADRDRIYQEEKARAEAQAQITAEAAQKARAQAVAAQKQATATNRRAWIIVLVMFGIVYALYNGSRDRSAPSSPSPSAIVNNLATTGDVVPVDHTVTYKVTGSARTASVTYENGTGGTEQKAAVRLPWSLPITAKSEAYLYISAQNDGDSGDLTAEIDVDGQTRKSANASGAYTIADVKDTL